MNGLVVGIDASRNRSGGAKAHLIGILTECDPTQYRIREIHLWSYQELLDSVPNRPWLIKHNPKELEQSLFRQLWWQRYIFHNELKESDCSIVLNTDAGTISRFRPSITMSRDMLSYEPGEIERFGFSKARLRLFLLRYIQNRSLRQADGVIFLTRYAAKVIQQSCGFLSRIALIPHGVGADFKFSRSTPTWPNHNERPIQCLYISNTALYKHQWVVAEAITALRKLGNNLCLTLVGGGTGRAQQLLDQQIAISDPDNSFIKQLPFIPQRELPARLAGADLFIFASTCENMPNTLVEAMAVGLPVACSERGPMPEVLSDGGVYFNPEDSGSIADAIKQIIEHPMLRATIAQRAKSLSKKYSWSRCAAETWEFIVNTYEEIRA